MQYILLLLVILLVATQNILQKQYNQSAKLPKPYLFLSITSFSAMLFFIFSSGGRLHFTLDVFWYALAFAISFISAILGLFLSIKWGSLSISMLVNSYSLIVPTLYGIFFLKEELGGIGVLGLLLLILSLFLIADKKQKVMFSLPWVMALLFSFFGNGMCSTIQKAQQIAFDGGYKNELMIMALLICGGTFFLLSCIFHENFQEARLCVGMGILNGVANGGVNLMMLVLTGLIPNAILFPSVSAGGVVLGFVTATFIYKERLSHIQLVGYFIGTLSIILLNL
ncbi:hypothetical protein [Ructibacterium gallinarum]|uniref:EamA domain-containing protein n=1 Tax=Ructibacterium gallinarum TaxID=2779355 RepID=A0A9D5RAT2_9FIRM|nr:hypothetical protein [Ructibacterium gallinarum]MBE5039388.1 hypothetical protein [Ructibacterium gallinarum]